MGILLKKSLDLKGYFTTLWVHPQSVTYRELYLSKVLLVVISKVKFDLLRRLLILTKVVFCLFPSHLKNQEAQQRKICFRSFFSVEGVDSQEKFQMNTSIYNIMHRMSLIG